MTFNTSKLSSICTGLVESVTPKRLNFTALDLRKASLNFRTTGVVLGNFGGPVALSGCCAEFASVEDAAKDGEEAQI